MRMRVYVSAMHLIPLIGTNSGLTILHLKIPFMCSYITEDSNFKNSFVSFHHHERFLEKKIMSP